MTDAKPRYIPKTIGEISDHLSMMMISSPLFRDKTGYFPDLDLETVFVELEEGLRAIRAKIGEESYGQLSELSTRMRTHFEADPEDKTEDGIKGRECIVDMKDILRSAGRRKR